VTRSISNRRFSQRLTADFARPINVIGPIDLAGPIGFLAKRGKPDV
jgi:hypothetical protein